MDNKGSIFERKLSGALETWLEKKEGLMVYGARQVGKTTFLKKLIERYISPRYLSFDELAVFNRARENPEAFLRQAAGGADVLVIDEFQRLPEITLAVKQLVDKGGGPKIFLSGSVSDSLARGGDSMAGRVIRFPLYTLSFAEFLSAKGVKADMDWDFNKIEIEKIRSKLFDKLGIFEAEFKSYLQNGGYPATIYWEESQFPVYFENLRTTFLEKDMMEKLRQGQTGQLADLLTILAKRVGSLLSFGALGSDLGIDVKTLRKLFSILELSYWIKTVRSEARYGSEVKGKFKTYFLDTGLRNYLAGVGRADWGVDLGAAMENCVFGTIERHFAYHGRQANISFWRTYGGGEVDFIVESGGVKTAVEVKAGEMKRPETTLSLRNYIGKYAPQQAIVVNKNYFGEMKIAQTRVYWLPVYVFAGL